MKTNNIYLDYNASTPIAPEVNKKIFEVNSLIGNSSSSHYFGFQNNEQISNAKQIIKSFFNIPHQKNKESDEEIIFTSGATEGINMVLNSVVKTYPNGHIITTKTEHKAVLDFCNQKKEDYEISYLDVDKEGMICLSQLKEEIRSNTCLICIMWVNNETGVIQPISKISEIARDNNTLLMVDGTQTVGKLKVDFIETTIDYFICSAHKFYGPKGVGLVYQNLLQLKTKDKLKPFIFGGEHQNKLRAGTLNISGIVGLATALTLFEGNKDEIARIRSLRDYLEKELLKINGVTLNNSTTKRVINTSNIAFKGIETKNLLIACKNLAFSNGSACNSDQENLSHVLKAMGYNDKQILGSVRISIGRYTTKEEVQRTIENMTKNYQNLKFKNFSI